MTNAAERVVPVIGDFKNVWKISGTRHLTCHMMLSNFLVLLDARICESGTLFIILDRYMILQLAGGLLSRTSISFRPRNFWENLTSNRILAPSCLHVSIDRSCSKLFLSFSGERRSSKRRTRSATIGRRNGRSSKNRKGMILSEAMDACKSQVRRA